MPRRGQFLMSLDAWDATELLLRLSFGDRLNCRSVTHVSLMRNRLAVCVGYVVRAIHRACRSQIASSLYHSMSRNRVPPIRPNFRLRGS